MREKTVCFTGHRNIPSEQEEKIRISLEKVLEDLIDSGYRFFGAGGAIGFDTIAAQTVLKLKAEKYPQIRLILVLPCRNQAEMWKAENRRIYEEIKAQADKVVFTSENYSDGCMQKRNRHLVQNSSVCVCYMNREKGGTFYTVNYARQQKLKIYNLWKF